MSKRIWKVLLYTVVIGYAALTLFPFLWSVLTSLKATPDVSKVWVPLEKLTLDNYIKLIGSDEYSFSKWFLNSLIVAVIVTAGNLVFNSMAGYALARINFPGKTLFFLMVLGVMMVPGQVILVPIYILLSSLGWVDNYAALTIPWLVNGFGIFLMRQFFLSIPKELEEAGFIDGLTRWGVFWRIVMPLARPALATQAIFQFMGNWNSFMWPNLLTTSEEMYTLPVGLATLYGEYDAFWNHIMAGAMFMTVPVIIVFLIFQRHFIKGIATTGLK
ncbi:carbohydrate ABC transporter permease [Staphylospora marina]|uniref:carbohydrate ABC transporter permease n=1 Tax=Staphylospora marina TaxID=2490858 RepID=UPI000F5BC658|nr:carbohydrate ABC transporter permease [Staphylospora marina]